MSKQVAPSSCCVNQSVSNWIVPSILQQIRIRIKHKPANLFTWRGKIFILVFRNLIIMLPEIREPSVICIVFIVIPRGTKSIRNIMSFISKGFPQLQLEHRVWYNNHQKLRLRQYQKKKKEQYLYIKWSRLCVPMFSKFVLPCFPHFCEIQTNRTMHPCRWKQSSYRCLLSRFFPIPSESFYCLLREIYYECKVNILHGKQRGKKTETNSVVTFLKRFHF